MVEHKAGHIIEKIVQQTDFKREEVLEQIERLGRSLKYGTDKSSVIDEDPTIPQLLVQEMNVDLGDPVDYLYVELLFDQYPQYARIIPFITVNKEKIKRILGKYVEKPKKWIPKEDEVAPVILAVEPTVLRDGILVHYEEYSTTHPSKSHKG
ncbi:MAG: hypothetical protein ACFFAE_16690 [Candidatus Hodarchaeota archaeon]